MAPALQRLENESFDALYRGHVRDVYRYSLSLVRDPAEAEDVTQTTFLNALEAFGEHPPREPRQYLTTIARNLVYDRHRQSQRRPQQMQLYEMPSPPPEDVSVGADELVAALQGVPSRQRIALLLDGLEGRSRAEIAAELGIKPQTVANLLTRGRQNLRLQLDEGMNCKRARILGGKLWGNAARAERRAALAHLRYCERCAGIVKPRSLFGLGTILLSLRDMTAQAARLAPEGAGLGKLAAVAAGSSLVTKAAVVAAVGTLAGGVAFHQATGNPTPKPSTPEVAAVAAKPVAAKRAAAAPRRQTAPSAVHEAARPVRQAAPAAANPHRSRELWNEPTPAAATTDSAGAVPRGAMSTSQADRASSSVTGSGVGAEALAESADDEAQKHAAGATAGQTEDRGADDAAAPVKLGNPGQGNPAGGQATAPGQQDNPGHGNPGGGRATAPGQQINPGEGSPAGGHATAPGQQDNPGQGNSGGGQATPPGQQDDPGHGDPVGGQATAPGQQINPGEGSRAGSHATAPGQQDNPGQGNSGGGQATPPVQQDDDPGQGNPGSGPATAPGQHKTSG